MKRKMNMGAYRLLNRKAFTLIELLAVIVILAIIALIAVPIILNIINSSKDSSNQRSVELYGSAVENAIAKAQLNGEEISTGDLSKEFLDTVQYNGSRVECETNKLYQNGGIYLEKCKIEGDTKEYTYGTKEVTKHKPQYYSFASSGGIGESKPSDVSLTPPEGKQYYLGLDVEKDKVSTGYICFIRNETEYCLKGHDAEAYNTNVDILNDAFADVENACSIVGGSYSCTDGSWSVDANTVGTVSVIDGSAHCFVNGAGRVAFECRG